MHNPVSTYRLQFQKKFTFQDLQNLTSYFRRLGIGTVYASPILESVAGSTHGYDGVNPERIDPELGGIEGLRNVSRSMREAGISWLQDIVPNHMAFHSGNLWLMDVLEKGTQSIYAGYFDIAWNNRLFKGRIMVPFLEKTLEEAIADHEIKVNYTGDRLVLDYAGSQFPLSPSSYATVLGLLNGEVTESIQQLTGQLDSLLGIEEPVMFSAGWNEWLMQFKSIFEHESTGLNAALEEINQDRARIRQLADQQNYVLYLWQKTEEQINFRRFFTVNGLICLNIQHAQVFDEYHSLINQLLEDGVFQGVRVDHVDGLFDPSDYMNRLRGMAGEDAYIVIEKILEKNEHLPGSWPIQGTTGYDFLAAVNNLLTYAPSIELFDKFYKELTGNRDTVQDQLAAKKAEILYGHMAGELDNLTHLFTELELTDQETLERIGLERIRDVIAAFLIQCPVYRYYGNNMPLPEEDIQSIKDILISITREQLDLSMAVELLEQCFIHIPALGDGDYNRRALEFYQRCMQFTGPLMAKGGEDTLMYTYNRFIGHNEVGDSPDRFGESADEFHQWIKNRSKAWPFAINATATHDTKRGEDTRARLNVLTDVVPEWIEKVREWQNLTAEPAGSVLDDNDKYLIYQAVVGAHPMPGEETDQFSERMAEFLQKALREAKTNTTWSAPNAVYEQAAKDFLNEILQPDSPFSRSLNGFLTTINDFGIINSLVQLVLKFACPGIPDVYQGCELWDFSLVDPDNRRPVDFEKRNAWLNEIEDSNAEELPRELWKDRSNGKIKLWLTQRLFQLRSQYPTLFTTGEYIPLKIRGAYKDHLLAFGRRQKKDFFVIVVPLHAAHLCRQQQCAFSEVDWRDTHIVLPENMLPSWDNVLLNQKSDFETTLFPASLFADLPFAIVRGTKSENKRKAGLLLHITSLASPFGVGDIGPQAFAFADFLERSGQGIWQILPLNPTEGSQGYSPYSALSSRAGNPLLISPEALAGDGWLAAEELAEYHRPPSSKVDYAEAQRQKDELLEKAYRNYNKLASSEEVDRFAADNKLWLDDFVAYALFKKRFDNKPWYEWPEELRMKDRDAILRALDAEKEWCRFVRWQQYVFDKQWKKLRSYCNDRKVRLVGDLPFYVSYDSADVWANRDLFCVDRSGRMSGMAGVPPDAFSEDGQLWGMPVFNWHALKEQGYRWWIERIARNMEMFDMIRLDHFRAFYDFWEVPGGEKTAVNGVWQAGPGMDFFEKVKSALGQLPFIAEDLGEMSPGVYELRDKLNLPGMKVLQFAFDENMAESDHAPHNYHSNFIAYTGTHDNNTTKGWFRQMQKSGIGERLEAYLGKPVNEDNVCLEMARLAYASVANVAILPIQDILNLDEQAKMNQPGSMDDNWTWRLMPGQITEEAERFIVQFTTMYNRD